MRELLVPGPQRLQQRLMSVLSLDAQDALALIQRSRVMVDGRIQTRNCWVDSHEITVNGHSLALLGSLAFLVHKPQGYALTEGDPLKRPTYQQLLPDTTMVARPLGPVDLASSGLLLLTNIPELRLALGGPEPMPLPATFMVRLKDRPTGVQIALLESKAPYDEATPLLIQDITDAEEEADELEQPELVPPPDDLGALMHSSIARWPSTPRRKQHARPKKLLPMLLMVVSGGTAKGIRHALSLVEAQPQEICCIRWGPLSLEEMSEPGSMRPLSQAEVQTLTDACGIKMPLPSAEIGAVTSDTHPSLHWF
ncbi:unnamed protein product [Durusdinium trenchii]|uniref:RNA-binding S4 domain-containing protein n=1 Tax=Durusdinium trenchii TaxID=1381693 RepID=A0ABP0JFH7_9DINO